MNKTPINNKPYANSTGIFNTFSSILPSSVSNSDNTVKQYIPAMMKQKPIIINIIPNNSLPIRFSLKKVKQVQVLKYLIWVFSVQKFFRDLAFLIFSGKTHLFFSVSTMLVDRRQQYGY